MHGVSSLLDDTHYAAVERLWAELAATFGVRGVYITPYPHFSYHVAEHYDLAALESILQQVAGQTAPFQVRTAGLGVFTGPQPVLYVPVVRTQALSRVHAMLWPALAPAAAGINDYYHPDRWLPHITIGYGDVPPDRLAAIIPYLAPRSFDWTITVDAFAAIYEGAGGQEVRVRVPFGRPVRRDTEGQS